MTYLSMIIRIHDFDPAEDTTLGEIRIYSDARLELFKNGVFHTSYKYQSRVPV